MSAIKRIKIKTTSPLTVRRTLEEHGWYHDFTLNTEMVYKYSGLRSVPIKKDIPKRWDFSQGKLVTPTPIPQEELETRCKNVVSFFPANGNFLGPIRQRLHNMMQGLPHPDDRKFVEDWMDEHYPLEGVKR